MRLRYHGTMLRSPPPAAGLLVGAAFLSAVPLGPLAAHRVLAAEAIQERLSTVAGDIASIELLTYAARSIVWFIGNPFPCELATSYRTCC